MADLSDEHLQKLEQPHTLPQPVLTCLGHAAAAFALCELRHGPDCKQAFLQAVKACLTHQAS